MDVRTCDHLKEDGFCCKSPALRGRNYCYFHLKLRGRRFNMARARILDAEQPVDFPFPVYGDPNAPLDPDEEMTFDDGEAVA